MAGQTFLTLVSGIKTVLTAVQTGGVGNANKLMALNSSGYLDVSAFPSLSGDVTSSAGSGTLTIAAKAVTLAKMSDMAAGSLIYRKSSGIGAPEVNSLAALKTDLNYVIGDIVGAQDTANLSTNMGTDTGSDSKYPSVKAVETYVASKVAGLLELMGDFNASGNVWPAAGSGLSGAIIKGDAWVISVGGSLGGSAVSPGDVIFAKIDAPGSTATNWSIVQNNITYVPEDAANKVTSISSSSTDNQYPSAKLLYDLLSLNGTLTKSIVTTEDIAAGSLVNIYASGCRKANATTSGLQADGFVTASTTGAGPATVHFAGQIITGLSGLTLGTKYVLSTTAGGILSTANAPLASGNVYQPVGVAVSTTELLFNPEEPIVYA